MELRVRVMSLEETRRTQRPYRYGMMLLCVGALVNWLGLAENYSEPVRYAGVACILAGACLICTAMCCWLHTPGRSGANGDEGDDPVHVISTTEERRREKPPDYDTVAAAPPSYDDAIKLDPAALLRLSKGSNITSSSNSNTNYLPTAHPSSSQTLNNGTSVVDVSSSSVSQIVDSSMAFIDEKVCSEKPPPYLAQPASSTADEQTSHRTN
ncbi:uncharacterized protein LOC118511007 isoform X1 [Anopheles stephensi]|uniref:uncharacterized protein LOC118511007 isoform X1 n=2 Tax=Anopheles stephensi TaxID=30069 RepID=UPI001658A970|nr:uncharacterized protein LOC118511007 isoform X1 [Anopheles stephensi]